MRTRCSVVFVLLFAFAMAVHAAPFTPPNYTLQLLPGNATAISNTGWVAGTITDAQFVPHPYRWRAGQLEMLRDFGRGGVALDINDTGEAVGYAEAPLDMPVYSRTSPAVRFTSGLPEILGTVSGPEGSATAINNRGQIVGTGFHDNLLFESFAWENGSIRRLPTDPPFFGPSQATAINQQGQIVGWESPSPGVTDEGPTAVTWINSAARSLTAHGIVTSKALSINGDGIAVGWIGPPVGRFQEPMTKFPVFWDTVHGTEPTPLAPGVQGMATAVNGQGLAVGNSASGFALLFAAGQAFRLQNLLVNAPGWTITRAQDINDAGQILAQGYTNRQGGSVMLTPVPARYRPAGGGR